MRDDAIGIMVEGDTGGAHHESVCSLGSEDCTHCSYGCTELDLFLYRFNIDEVVHGRAISKEFLLNK